MRIDFDGRAYEIENARTLKAFERAAVFTLTDSAKYANADFIAALGSKIDRPAPFTLQKSGYGVTMAKFGAGSDMFSEAFVKPGQAAYLKFVIDGGGMRGPGAAGASAKSAFVPGKTGALGGAYSASLSLSRFGGIPRGATKRFVQKIEAERAVGRMSKAQHAMTLREAGHTTGTAPSSKGGVFYGTINGRTGFWARPKRTAPITAKQEARALAKRGVSYALRQRDPTTGRFVDTGRSDFSATASGRKRRDARVRNKGVPVLLIETVAETKHHEIVGRQAIMEAAHKRSIGEFNARFERAMRSSGGGGGTH